MPLRLHEGAEPVPGYILEKVLGTGGFGEVWKAIAPGGIPVALKFIRVDGEAASIELRALHAVCRLRHHFLLEMHWAQQIDDRLVIATSLCDGSLLDRLKKCRTDGLPGIPFPELLRYMDQAAEALDYLNAPRHPDGEGNLVGIQHRDIKPHNIFLMENSVKVADFGLAKVIEHSVTGHTGAMTPHYAPPEMFRGAVSDRSDQYSLAVAYCQLRTGRMPFNGDFVMQVIYKILNEEPDLNALALKERKIVRRAMAKDPNDRWANCLAFVNALRRVNAPLPASRSVREGQRANAVSKVGLSSEPASESARVDRRRSLSEPADISVFPFARLISRKTSSLFAALGAFLVVSAALMIFVVANHGTATTKLLDDSHVDAADSRSAALTLAETDNDDPQPRLVAPSGEPTLLVAPFTKAAAEKAQMAWAAALESDVEITDAIGMKLRLIPPGEFTMGSRLTVSEVANRFDLGKNAAQRWFSSEHPRHRVRITKPYYLGTHEVTVGQFRRFVKEKNYVTEAEREGGSGYDEAENTFEVRNPEYNWQNTGFPLTEDHPATNVTWDDAAAFCRWLSKKSGQEYRLPTEAQWEYACRAGTETLFHTGDRDEDLIRAGNVADRTAKTTFERETMVDGTDGYVFTAPVGMYAANPLGLHDMHGNVFEWCADWFAGWYYGMSPLEDPSGPSLEQEYRVLRGGGWLNDGADCRSAARYGHSPGDRLGNIGFRVALIPAEP